MLLGARRRSGGGAQGTVMGAVGARPGVDVARQPGSGAGIAGQAPLIMSSRNAGHVLLVVEPDRTGLLLTCGALLLGTEQTGLLLTRGVLLLGTQRSALLPVLDGRTSCPAGGDGSLSLLALLTRYARRAAFALTRQNRATALAATTGGVLLLGSDQAVLIGDSIAAPLVRDGGATPLRSGGHVLLRGAQGARS